MALWNMTDANTGAPKFAVAGGLGVSANGNVLFDNVTVGAFHTGTSIGVFGVSNTEAQNTTTEGANTTHAGWVLRKEGTGYVQSITVVAGGNGYTPGSGFITFTGGGSGVGANATYQVNAAGSIANVTMNYVGNTYNIAPSVNAAVAYTNAASFTVVMGGRTGRKFYETIVAAGSMSADVNGDNTIMGA